MLDLSYFQNQNSNVQGFFNGGTWQTWIKPRGAKLVNIICVGSGAGGGGGHQSATTPRSGGAGGGGGAIARLTINANLLPDILYILPGIGGTGGLGGTTATPGSSGQSSFVTLAPSTASISGIVLRSGTVVATGGTAGLVGATNAASISGETAGVIGNNIFANLGNFTFQAGVSSTQGGSTTGQTAIPSSFITAGIGGGGTGVGGNVVATGIFPATAATAANTNGISNIIFYKPILMLYGGGGGGGSLTSGNGGNGGNGSPGAGGGGGGASFNTGVNAGNGGKGGDGFVIITTSI